MFQSAIFRVVLTISSVNHASFIRFTAVSYAAEPNDCSRLIQSCRRDERSAVIDG